MSKYSHDLKSLRQNDNDLMVQYEELLCLRAELARLLFPLKSAAPRKRRMVRSHRSAARAARRRERSATASPVLLLVR